MILDFEHGDKVVNPMNKERGIGQVQSIIKHKVTVNFQNVGKKPRPTQKKNRREMLSGIPTMTNAER